MLSAQEIARGIYGAWRLALFDKSGVGYFDNTPGAAIASFKAALLAAPVHLILIVLQTDWAQVSVGWFATLLIHVISFVIDWTAFPLAMYYVARLCAREHNYFRYVVAYNWAQVLEISLFLIISVLAVGGPIPPALGGLLIFGALIAIFVYKGFIAYAALEATAPAIVGIVLLDLGLSALLSTVMANLLRGQGLLG